MAACDTTRGRFWRKPDGSAQPAIPQYRRGRRHRAAQDRRARPAGRPAQLCALVQIRERRQRAPVCGDQHPPHPQRHADRRATSRNCTTLTSRPATSRTRPTASAQRMAGEIDQVLATRRGRGGHRRATITRDLASAAQRLARTVDRADVRAIIDALAQATRAAAEKNARLQTQLQAMSEEIAQLRREIDRPAHGKPDRSPHRARQPPLLPRRPRTIDHRRAAPPANR